MKTKSFTLIELLVVIVIIGILAAVIVVSTTSSIYKANLAKGQVFSENVKKDLFFNLVADWNFDDSSNLGKDDAGNNNLTLYQFTQAEGDDCLFSKCIYSGSTSITRYAMDDNFNMPTQDFTIDFWVKMATDAPSSSYILTYASSTSFNEILIGTGGTNFVFYTNNSSHTYSANIKDNKWHYVTIMRDKTTDTNFDNTVYLDGNYINKISDTTGDLDPQGCFIIGQEQDSLCGAFDANQSFKGYLDSVRIYNNILSSAQIKNNYISGLNKLFLIGKISEIEYNQRINN
ncbi:MAG: prepilin-type N-terminal cleavage/methylation domain-containing protein [Candidatus Pacebacteria bacterium]|nr:prepilin-type N-terminal cleavage/methylation domain-containing protein [Candidatus Paceibacterota bacterium]